MIRQLPTETLGRLDQPDDSSHVDHERGDGERQTEDLKVVLLDFATSADLERRHPHDKNAHGKDLVSQTGQEDVVCRGGVLTSRFFHTDQGGAPATCTIVEIASEVMKKAKMKVGRRKEYLLASRTIRAERIV